MKPVSVGGVGINPLPLVMSDEAAKRSHNETETKTSWVFESVCSQEADCVSFSFSHSGDADDKEGGNRKSGRFQDFKAGVPVITGEFNGLFPP